jgi:outer membrane protein assembly factor BamB
MAAAPWQWSRRQFLKGMIAAGAAPYLVSASALGAAVPPGEGWIMAGANPARTSWVPEEVAGRLRPVWYRAIEPYISQNVQIIAADGKVFIATSRGLYALKAADGETAWVYPTEMPLGHSPTYHNGVLYVGGFDRRLHAIDAVTGKRLWTFDGAKAGYRTGPLVAENLVLLGNRDGTFYAVHAHGTPKQGTLAWKYQTEGPINYSAAYKDGVVYFASMDMHAYALRAADGKEKWETEKLYGAGFQSWWPVIWRDRVIFATGHNYRNGLSPGSEDCESAKRGGYYHDAEYQAIFGSLGEQDYIGPTGTEPGDWVKGTFTIDATRAAKYFGQKPWRRMLYCLDAATGKDWEADLDSDGKPERAPFLWTGSKNGVPPPPMVSGFDNVLYRHNQYAAQRGARSQIAGWKFAAPFVSRITSDYGASDEPHIASGGGRYLYWSLCGDRESGWIDLSKPWTPERDRSREGPIFPGYHLYQVCPGYDEMWFGVGDQDGTGNRLWGYYGSTNGIYHNQTNDQNPFIPYQGHLYIHRSNAVICFGPEGGAKKQPLAGTQAPLRDTPVTLSEADLKQLLAQEVRKWLAAGHLHTGYFNASQFDHTPRRYQSLSDYFEDPAENLWVLLRAMPHVPEDLRAPLREFIQKEYAAYPPATTSTIGWKDGASRDYFLYPAEVDAARANYPAGMHGGRSFPWRGQVPPLAFYVLWKYAQEFGGPQEVYAAVKGKLPPLPPESDWLLYPYEINACIAGHLGYLELEKLAGQPETAAVRDTLKKLLTWRAENFSKDTPFPPKGPYNKAQPNSHANRINLSRNFIFLTPELGQHLHDLALAKVQEAVEEYNRVGPYWFVSRYEGCLQEATVQNLHDYFALLQAKAWILKESREELVKYLDVPGFARGDCFYIHNLLSALEARPAGAALSPR